MVHEVGTNETRATGDENVFQCIVRGP
jgi:hypothetical protein